MSKRIFGYIPREFFERILEKVNEEYVNLLGEFFKKRLCSQVIKNFLDYSLMLISKVISQVISGGFSGGELEFYGRIFG